MWLSNRNVLGWAATALLAFCGASLMAEQARDFPNTTHGIVAYTDQIRMLPLTEAQVQFAATHYVGGQKQTAAEAAHLRSYNPNFLVLHYRLGQMLGYGACDANGNPTETNALQIIDTNWVEEWPGDGVVEPQWFFQYAGSPRVYDCGMQHFLMDISNPSYRKWWSKEVMRQLKDNDDDGVFADSFSTPNQWQSWTPALPPYDPALEAVWAKNMHDFTAYMVDRFHGRWKWIPNVGDWTTTRDATDYTNVDGAMIEGFADRGNGNFHASVDWVLQMNRALSLINRDKIVIAQSYPGAGGGFTFERLELTASFLLVKGKHTYLNIAASGGLDPGGTTLQWWPEYEIDLGRPTDPLPSNNDITRFLDPTWNVYVRHYQKGMVLVNTTDTDSGTIDLGGTYYMITGDGNSGGAVVPADPSTWPSRNQLSYTAVSTVDLTSCSQGASPYPDNSHPCAAILFNVQP